MHHIWQVREKLASQAFCIRAAFSLQKRGKCEGITLKKGSLGEKNIIIILKLIFVMNRTLKYTISFFSYSSFLYITFMKYSEGQSGDFMNQVKRKFARIYSNL